MWCGFHKTCLEAYRAGCGICFAREARMLIHSKQRAGGVGDFWVYFFER